MTYSRSVVVPVLFQVRWMSDRPEWEGAVSPRGSSGRFPGCVALWSRVPFTLRYACRAGQGAARPASVASRGSVFQVLCRGDWRRVVTLCPVLKHGPRSARDAQVGRVVLESFPRV